MRSMTGYSKLSYQDDKYALNMELKSVNNKNLNLKIKLPYNLNFLEGAIRTEIASKVSRGSLDLKIEFSDLRDLGKLFDYDKEQSKGYMNVLLEMEKDFNEKFSNKMDILVRNLNVIKKNDFEIDEEEYTNFILGKIKELLTPFIKTREEEGERLRIYFLERISVLEANIDEIKKYKDQVVEIYKNKLLERLDKIKGNIEFRNVDFAYNEETPVLKNLSFKTGNGEVVAIVGPTGGGKTTIVNLLMRFYDITSGEILLDGINIEEYKKSEIRKLFGMVLQDSWLFTGTIKDNISYGNTDISFDKVIESAKLACAHDFIMKFPDGYNTMITEDNMILSQGQKQLITIARIIASDPKFLILDEATSGVDTRTEIRLQKAIANLIKGRTSFIIAHRLSTIKNADLILVLKDGKIAERGTHNELMNQNGFYFNLYSTQYAL